MTASKKSLIIFFLAAIGIAVAVGFYFFNKGPKEVKHADGIKVEAAIVYQAFLKDSTTAKEQYLNKILEVSGMVKKVSKNQQNEMIVMLQTSESGAFVNCTLEDGVAAILENKQATIKGICTGMGMGDADLGILGDVYLIRCYLIK